jgi:hypothetical protein
MAESPPKPPTCPDPSVHGNPFRYCPYCDWKEHLPDHTDPALVRKVAEVLNSGSYGLRKSKVMQAAEAVVAAIAGPPRG